MRYALPGVASESISGRIGDAARPGWEWRQQRQIVGLFDATAHLSVIPSAFALYCNRSHRRKEFAEPGLVKRRPHPNDKGGLLVHLTARGKSVADKAAAEIASSSIVTKTRISLSRQERKLMTKLCERILLDFEADPEFVASLE